MNIVVSSKKFAFQVFMLAAMSGVASAQETITVPQPATTPQQTPTLPQPATTPQQTPTLPQLRTTQRICSLDPVEDLLPPPQQNKQSDSVLSYLGQEGFIRNQEGAWVCYANDPKKEGRYYTVFKVQELDGKLIGSSFLDGGTLINGQDNHSIDFFMTLVERHMNASQENQQSIRRYLEAFVSLVKQGKIQPSRRGFLFDQPNRALVLYHTLTAGELKGTAITINIQLPKNLNSGSTKTGFPSSLRNTLRPNQ
ncbi:hypothetical protein A6770_17860 [Nostoc minutum NIES-26]|uniref:Uncharacterized protein n=1 Tax=Nostoc minutum NIES-26 TaxID=1844469 RepID=A0A367RAH2_9NOSO|nr:hypothetical protein A6770_17860 [Nostoc minutum NIES-26]